MTTIFSRMFWFSGFDHSNSDRLPKNTSIFTASRIQQIAPLWAAQGPDRAKALSGLHSFSWTDNTGRLAGIGKPAWFKLFMEAEDDVIECLCILCHDADMSEDLQLTLAQFVCTAYHQTGIQLSSIPELRWQLSCKFIAESEKLPAPKQYTLRAHVEGAVWGQAAVFQQDLLDPVGNGYHRDSDDGQLQPTATDVLPAPEAILEMIRCQCNGNCSSNRCSCKSKSMRL